MTRTGSACGSVTEGLLFTVERMPEEARLVDGRHGVHDVFVEDEFFDPEATKRVANRALVSALISFLGASIAAVVPFPPLLVLPFLLIAVIVGISASRPPGRECATARPRRPS